MSFVVKIENQMTSEVSFWEKEGFYNSWSANNWDQSDWFQVKPVQVQITEYIPV